MGSSAMKRGRGKKVPLRREQSTRTPPPFISCFAFWSAESLKDWLAKGFLRVPGWSPFCHSRARSEPPPGFWVGSLRW